MPEMREKREKREKERGKERRKRKGKESVKKAIWLKKPILNMSGKGKLILL